MKKGLLYIICLLPIYLGCSKAPASLPTIAWDGNVVAHAPLIVTKAVSKKVFTHYMPWFETPASNGGFWGQHWTMANQNPNIISGGKRQIASYYYPLNTGPYATGDTNVIDYQLLLMKLSGIDGIFIDWPGTINYSDYPGNVANTNAVVSRLAKAGMKYAIVYEDQNLQYVTGHSAQITQAQTDMLYIQNNYFKDTATTYEMFNGKPLLLDFGPFGPLSSASDWNTVFSVMSAAPSFVTDEYRYSIGGTNAVGEFCWVVQSNLTNLTGFYSSSHVVPNKISVAYPGFNSFYTAGGWPNSTPWTISYINGSQTTFDTTLSLAINQPGNYIQLVTWNDYGEGTMIEPTTQFQYSFLTTLQQKLGVQSLSQSDLQQVAKLYTARANNTFPVYDLYKLNELNQVYYDMVSLKMDSAIGLLNNF